MNVEIKIEDHVPERTAKLESSLEKFVKEGAAYVEGQLTAKMIEGKSGRAYKRGKDGVHIASAPGEAPADDSGNLLSSIDVIEQGSLERLIGTPVEYGVYLETGTSRMAQRPMWEVTAKESLPTLEALLERAVKEAGH